MEYLIVIAAAGLVAVLAVAVGRRAKAKGRRALGSLSGALGVFDEIYRPATAEASTIREAATRMPAPAPLAGGRRPDGDGN